jgi:hypothetical protein
MTKDTVKLVAFLEVYGVMVSAIESASEIGSTKIGFHYIDRYVVV